MFGQALQRSCMAMCVFCSTLLSFVFAGRLGINPMDLGLMCLSFCGLRRRQQLRRRKMMMVFAANCVATILVIYPCVALATLTCVHLACPCIVVPYRAEWFVHRDIGAPICCYPVGFAASPCYQTGDR